MKEKKSFIPWKSTLAILVFFGLVMAFLFLRNPIRIQYHLTKLRSDDVKVRHAAEKNLIALSVKGTEALSREYIRQLCGNDNSRRFAALDGLVRLGEQGEKAMESHFPEGTDAGKMLFAAWKRNMPSAPDKTLRARRRISISSLSSTSVVDEYEKGFIKYPLHAASRLGYLLVASLLIERALTTTNGRQLLDKKDNEGCTPLYHAAISGCNSVVRMLVEKGADMKKMCCGEMPLHAAARKGHYGLVSFFISKGMDPDLKDATDWTPLHWAAALDRSEIAECLIDGGALVDETVYAGATALNIAAQEGNTEVAKVLVAMGAEINMQDAYGWTPLHSAAFFGKPDMAEFLVSKGADVNLLTFNKQTPLDFAANEGNDEIVSFLIKNGSRPKYK
ncbi:MAG: ankyrin repeat domain-containing protein [Planctomycetota bacterium]|jgi:ankyrin repeat protein